jgi:signal transduction histidine kinase/phage shock protein PspC (stress-responsive transcriptional regulator)
MRPLPRPPLERGGDGALVAGVAAGLARHLGVDALKVRLAFVVLTVTGGAGIVLYGAFWFVLPRHHHEPAEREHDPVQLSAMAALVVGGMLLASELGLFGLDLGFVWPVLVVAVGLGIVWRQADESSRARWFGAVTDQRSHWLRITGGTALLLAGVVGFLASNHELQAAREGIVATVVVVAGLALVLAPWWWQLVQDLGAERRERIRSQERADLAAHLHDSVLQTLALIQRRVDSPQEVQRLARSQERALRSWLYSRRDNGDAHHTFASAIEAAAAEVESDHGLPLDVVTVGDCALDDRLESLVRAAREAMVNASKFARVDHADVFAEVDDRGVTVFVRDTGVGFDPDAVPADRRGLADSVVGRMARHGGSTAVRSAPGEGTEIELHMERVLA